MKSTGAVAPPAWPLLAAALLGACAPERFGVDFDGDGHVDMVRSNADALASTAHYLEAHGWRPREPYGVGSVNFTVLREWNASEVYRKTIVLFASKLRGR